MLKKITLLCAFAVMITFETQKCRKKTLCFSEFKSVTNRDEQKRFSQNKRPFLCVHFHNFLFLLTFKRLMPWSSKLANFLSVVFSPMAC